MNELSVLIRDEIASQGPMRFERFMDLALYHPRHGYYVNGCLIGRRGDFFTSVSVGPLFGRLLARQFLQMWELLGRPAPFWIFEQGAHDGQLAVDILTWCGEASPEFQEAVRYGIVESNPAGRALQEKMVARLGLSQKVEWLTNLEEIEGKKPEGVFVSNELVDAFPIRAIRREDGRWRERFVKVTEEKQFGWVDRNIEDEVLRTAIDAILLPEIEGYTTEINLAARTWIKKVAQALHRGYVLTFDYGFPASVYYASFRTAGTLSCYRNHRRGDDVLKEPGSQDITAHVDFTALCDAGRESGLTTLGFVDQQRFLMGVAYDELNGAREASTGIVLQTKAWNTLTHPEHLGARFQVLLQGKDEAAGLDGLRFAQSGGLD